MKIRLFLRRSTAAALLAFTFVAVIIGCTDTTGSAGAVAVFDSNSRCRYCNERITDDDIGTLSEHGNGVCAQTVNFVDPATHLCNYCGKPWVYNAWNSHGEGVCVYPCAGATGHRVPAEGNHAPCEICGGWLCVSQHGEGVCGTLEPTPAPTPDPTPTPTPTPEPTLAPTPTPKPRTLWLLDRPDEPAHTHTYGAYNRGEDIHWRVCTDSRCPDANKGRIEGSHVDEVGGDDMCDVCRADLS